MKKEQLIEVDALDITGAKAGQEKARKPNREPDSASTVAYMSIAYGLSEGVVRGFGKTWSNSDLMRRLYLDGTPVMAADGTMMQQVEVDFRDGSVDQTPIEGLPAQTVEHAIDLEIRSAAPISRSFVRQEVNSYEVRIRIPVLVENNTDGDSVKRAVTFAIDVATGSGSFAEYSRHTIYEKISQGFQRTYPVVIPKAGTRSIRVRRITPDNTNSLIVDKIYLEAITEVVEVKFTYPHTAILWVKYDARNYSSVPKMELLLDGKSDIKIPTNYDPDTRTYATTGAGTTGGVWDGTFKLGYTDCPVWQWLDLATSRRYGIGNRITIDIPDKFYLYALAKYCDELVPDGAGGQEPRFTCNNLYLQKAEDAFKVFRDIASVFRAKTVWDGTHLNPKMDVPRDAMLVFSRANVTGLKYGTIGNDAQHNLIGVQFFDTDNMYKSNFAYARDLNDIKQRQRVVDTNVTAIGCTSQGQAQRMAEYLLQSELQETGLVSFTTGLDGMRPIIGDVFVFADDLMAGKVMSGRVVSTSGLTVTLDRELTPALDLNGTFIVNTTERFASTRVIKAIAADKKTITLDKAVTVVDIVGLVWAVQSASVGVREYVVDDITYDSDTKQFNISGVQYSRNKYPASDAAARIENPPVTIIDPLVPSAVTTITATYHMTVDQGINVATVDIAWSQNPKAVWYELEFRRDGGTWQSLGKVVGLTFDMTNVYNGIYEFRIRAIDALGTASIYTQSQPLNVQGKVLPPPALASFRVDSKLFGVTASWTFPPNATDSRSTRVEVALQDPALVPTVSIQAYDKAYPDTTLALDGMGGNVDVWMRAALVDKYGAVGAPTLWLKSTTGADPSDLLEVLQGHIGVEEISKDLAAKIDTATETAQQAQSTATAAKTAADAATATANNAKSTADLAKTTADQAKTTATNAQTMAQTASTAASNAQTTANTAKTTADAARTTANTAKTTADAAKLLAETNKAETDQTIADLAAATEQRLGFLQDGITQEASYRKSADDAQVASLNAYKTSNDAAVSAVQQTANSAVSKSDANASALTALTSTVNLKVRTYRQNPAPTTGLTVGDLWINTTPGKNMEQRRWNGTAWEVNTDPRTEANATALTNLSTQVTNIDGRVTANSNSLTAVKSDLTNLTNTVGTKADASAVTALDTKVTQQGTQITSQATQLTNLEAKVATNTNNINKKLDASVITDYYTKAENNAATAGAIQAYDADLVIGGNNLLKATEQQTSYSKMYSANVLEYLTSPRALTPTVKSTATAGTSVGVRTLAGIKVIKGQKYSLSFRTATSAVRINYLYLMSNVSGLGNQSIPVSMQVSTVDTALTYVTVTFTALYDYDNAYIMFSLRDAATTDWIIVAEPMLVNGSKATTWTPSALDAITSANASASAIQNIQTQVLDHEGRITANSTSITTLNGKVATVENGLLKKADASAVTALETKVNQQGDTQTAQGTQLTNLTASLANMKVGGANLQSNSHFNVNAFNGWQTVYGTLKVENSKLIKTFPTTHAAARIEKIIAAGTLESGQEYVLTINATTPLDIDWRGFVNATLVKVRKPTAPSETVFQNYTVVFKVTDGAVATNLRGYVANIAAGKAVVIEWEKLELGNVPTDWSPAVSDTASADAVQQLTARVSTAEGTITSQGQALTSLRADLTATNTKVDGKADASALTTLDNKVTQQGSTITSQGNQLTALDNRVTVTENGLKTKADASALSDLSTRVTANEQGISTQAQNLTSLKVTLDAHSGASLIPDFDLADPNSWDNHYTPPLAPYFQKITGGIMGSTGYVNDPAITPITTSWIYSKTSLPNNRKYRLTIRVRRSADSTSGSSYFTCRHMSKSGDVLTYKSYGISIPATGEWVERTAVLDYTADVDVAQLRFGFSLGHVGAAATRGKFEAQGFCVADVITTADTDASIATAAALTTTNAEVTRINGVVTGHATQITNLNTQVAGKADASALNALDNRVTVAEGNISSTSTAVTSLQNRVGAAETEIGKKANTTALTALETKVNQQGDTITSQSTQLTNLSASLTETTATSNNAFDLSKFQGQGKLMSTDPTFLTSTSALTTYGNNTAVAGTLDRVARSVDNPTASDFEMQRTFIGDPNLGNFGFAPSGADRAAKANRVMLQKMVLKFPVGYNLLPASNAVGTGGSNKMIGSTVGTGKFEVYYRLTQCGADGTFSSTNHIMIRRTTAPVPTAAAPMTLYIAQHAVFDVTDAPDAVPKDITDRITANANAITSTNAEVSRINGVVVAQGTQLTNLTATVAGKADGSALTALTTRVTDAEGKLTTQSGQLTTLEGRVTVTENGLKSKAEVSAVNDLNTRVTANEGAILSQATATTALKAALSGGSGVNLGIAAFTDPLVLFPMPTRPGHTPALVDSTLRKNGKAYTITLTNNASSQYIYMGNYQPATRKDAPIRVKKGARYLISYYTKTTATPALTRLTLRCFASDGTTAGNYVCSVVGGTTMHTVTETLTKVTWSTPVIPLEDAQTATLLFYGSNGTTPVGAVFTMDNIMIEELSGDPVEGSTYVPGSADVFDISSRIDTNASALTTTNAEVSRINGVVTAQGTQLTNLTAKVDTKADSSALTTLTTRVTAAEGTISTQSTQLTNLNTTVNLIDKKITIQDTRNTNELPNWYWTTYPSTEVNEFKQASVLGLTGMGTYVNLKTTVPFTNSTGGSVQQIATNGDATLSAYRRSTGSGAAATWLAWSQPIKDMNTELSTKASSSAVTSLDSRVTTAEGKITSQATQLTTLSTTVGNNSTTIQQHTSSIDGINSKWTVKIDNNGYASGFGLISTPNNGVPTSAFKVDADVFVVGKGATNFNPFIVVTANQTVDGITYPEAGAFMNSAYIAKATITTAHIKDGSITTAKIGDAQITTALIKDLAVDTAKIKDLAVDTGKIKDLAVNTLQIAYGSVTNGTLIDSTWNDTPSFSVQAAPTKRVLNWVTVTGDSASTVNPMYWQSVAPTAFCEVWIMRNDVELVYRKYTPTRIVYKDDGSLYDFLCIRINETFMYADSPVGADVASYWVKLRTYGGANDHAVMQAVLRCQWMLMEVKR